MTKVLVFSRYNAKGAEVFEAKVIYYEPMEKLSGIFQAEACIVESCSQFN